MKIAKNWFKNIKSQQGTTLAELLVALAIIGLIVPGLFAAFNAFIRVPPKESATLSSIGSVSHASDWVSKDASMTQCLAVPPERRYGVISWTDAGVSHTAYYYYDYDDDKLYKQEDGGTPVEVASDVSNDYLALGWHEDDGLHLVRYYWSSGEAVIRQEYIDTTPEATFEVASGIEGFDKADLNVIAFAPEATTPYYLVQGNLLSTHYAGAESIDRRADPYITVRTGAEPQFIFPPYQLFSAGSDILYFKGWTVDASESYANGYIHVTGSLGNIRGSLTTPGTILVDSTEDAIWGDLRAGGNIEFGGSKHLVGGDIEANGMIWGPDGYLGGTEHQFLGNLHANEGITVGGSKDTVGSEGTFEYGDLSTYSNVLSVGPITVTGGNHNIWGDVRQQVGTPSIDEDFVHGDIYADDPSVVALEDMPPLAWPIRVGPEDLISGEANLFTFSTDVTIQYPDPAEVWQSQDVLKSGVYYAPGHTITVKNRNSSNADPITGNVTFIAERIILPKAPNKFPEDINNFELTAYKMGILFYATGVNDDIESDEGTIEMKDLQGVDMEGIVYAPKGMIYLKGREDSSTFRFSGWSSIIGHLIKLDANKGTLKFTSIELDPTEGPPGTEVTLRGMGFSPFSLVKIFFEGQPTWIDTAMTDVDGVLDTTFNVSGSATEGFHIVRVEDTDGNWASALFRVTESS